MEDKGKTTEEWKPIKGCEGKYEVSNYGRVRSLMRKVRSKAGSSSTVRGCILSPVIVNGGYFGVTLSVENRRKRGLIHQLVWDTFGNKPRNGGLQIDHIDENKSNNCLDNLQLLSNRENSSKGKLKCGKSSQYTGVHKAQDGGNGWQAQIQIDGKRKYLGRYKTEELAHLAYQNALTELKQKIEQL